MKTCDKETITYFGIGSPVLMERAALACVDALMQHFAYKKEKIQPVLVLCGNGNNGGDGVAIARILHERGVRAVLCMAGRPASVDKLSTDCLAQYKSAQAYGVEEISCEAAMQMLRAGGCSTVVDAMFGVGLSRPLAAHYEALVRAVNESSAWVLAVDMPTGICADTGAIMGCAVRADVTVTFAFAKRGQLLYPGRAYCGNCMTADIGITKQALSRTAPEDPVAFAYEPADLPKLLPKRHADANKGTYGKALVIAGSREICGAAYLCGAAAYRTGAGLVRVLSEENNRTALQTMLPEALLSFYREDALLHADDKRQAVETLLADKRAWATAAAIGPGLSVNETAALLLETMLTTCKTPLVIDADGLNLLADRLPLLDACTCPVIVTPHMREMSRLTGVSVEELKADPVRHACAFAAAHRVTCVLKDACTVVASADGCVYLNTSGNDGMSTGGSGDVLTGIICGLLAQRMDAFHAACLGVYLHGLTGDFAAEKTGVYGLTATRLLAGLQELFHNNE